MTTQRTFKQRVRARVAKTGESYTAARRMLITAGDAPEAAPPEWQPTISDAAIVKATGRPWEAWLSLVDSWDGTRLSHPQNVRQLVDEHGVDPWWAQSITVGYEQARGLRAPGQHADGWAVGATKTIAVPVEQLFAAFEDRSLRERWLPGAELGRRTATRPRIARYDWEDGSTRIAVHFDALGESKSRVALQHERLPDAETADEMKAWWRERMRVLKALLEGDTNGG